MGTNMALSMASPYKSLFDFIEWNYLLGTLQLFNFGHDIQNWIKIIMLPAVF